MEPDLLSPLRAGLRLLAESISAAEQRAGAISSWSIGEHISHCAQVHTVVLTRMQQPTPADPGLQAAGERGLAVLASGSLPRGLAKAPAAVHPTSTDAASLSAALQTVESLIQVIEPELPRLFADPALLRHSAFGGLTRKQYLRLTDVHQRHHLLIINDIRAAG